MKSSRGAVPSWKNRILVSVLAGVFLVISACGEQEPTSAPTDLGPSLHTAPVPFSAVITNLTDGVPVNAATCLDGIVGVTEAIFDECEFPQTITGGLAGSGIAILDAEVDATITGESEGTLSYTACLAGGGCGTFEGEFEGEFTAGVFTFELELEGTDGAVEGVKIEATSTGVFVFPLTGTIRFPN